MENSRKILPGLTTTPGSDWRAKIEEIDKLKLKEIAIFPTCLGSNERKELYGLLEKTGLKEIPHVHARTDMDLRELDYLTEKWHTKVFNLHPRPDAFNFEKTKYWKNIFIENLHHYDAPENRSLFSEKAFEKHNISGVCLDISHLENERLQFPENYAKTQKMLEKYQIGCNHVSAIFEELTMNDFVNISMYDMHYMEKIEQLNYLKTMPLKYFSEFVSIELENSFKEQLEAKKYIEKIISEKE